MQSLSIVYRGTLMDLPMGWEFKSEDYTERIRTTHRWGGYGERHTAQRPWVPYLPF